MIDALSSTPTPASIETDHAFYLASDGHYGISDKPLSVLWTHVLTHAPELARMKLHDRLESVYARLRAGPADAQLAGLLVSRIQAVWWIYLDQRNTVLPHVAEMELAQNALHQSRFTDLCVAAGTIEVERSPELSAYRVH